MAGIVTTTTITDKFVWGNKRVHFATLAFDTGDYAAGGIAVTPGQFGLASISSVLFQGAVIDVAATPSALLPRFSPTNSKIELYEGAGSGASFTEKPAEAMGTGAKCHVVVIGR